MKLKDLCIMMAQLNDLREEIESWEIVTVDETEGAIIYREDVEGTLEMIDTIIAKLGEVECL